MIEARAARRTTESTTRAGELSQRVWYSSLSEPLGSPVNPHDMMWEDIRGSSEWRFPCGEPDEGRPSRPVRRAGISRPYYHYAFAMLLGSTLFVTFSRMWDSLSSWVDNRSSFIWIVSRFYNNKSRIIIELEFN
jgi:hypothetical protein